MTLMDRGSKSAPHFPYTAYKNSTADRVPVGRDRQTTTARNQNNDMDVDGSPLGRTGPPRRPKTKEQDRTPPRVRRVGGSGPRIGTPQESDDTGDERVGRTGNGVDPGAPVTDWDLWRVRRGRPGSHCVLHPPVPVREWRGRSVLRLRSLTHPGSDRRCPLLYRQEHTPVVPGGHTRGGTPSTGYSLGGRSTIPTGRSLRTNRELPVLLLKTRETPPGTTGPV